MRRRTLLTGLVGVAGLSSWPVLGQKATLPPVEVFKSPDCDCCRACVDHLSRVP